MHNLREVWTQFKNGVNTTLIKNIKNWNWCQIKFGKEIGKKWKIWKKIGKFGKKIGKFGKKIGKFGKKIGKFGKKLENYPKIIILAERLNSTFFKDFSKITIFWPNLDLSNLDQNINFVQNFYFWPKILFSAKNFIFGQKFYFRPKFLFSTKKFLWDAFRILFFISLNKNRKYIYFQYFFRNTRTFSTQIIKMCTWLCPVYYIIYIDSSKKATTGLEN